MFEEIVTILRVERNRGGGLCLKARWYYRYNKESAQFFCYISLSIIQVLLLTYSFINLFILPLIIQ